MADISRRALLAGTAAAAMATTLPAIAGAPAPVLVSAPPMPMWAVGTPGEWDYQAIAAPTEEAARRVFCCDASEADHEPIDPDCECEACSWKRGVEALRQPLWDGKDVTPALWLAGGLGFCCSRCGYECFEEDGAYPVGDEAVCERCLTLADLDLVDPARAAELREEAAADA